MEFAHTSVLLEETIEGLAIKPDGIDVDGTLGGAGHSSHIAARLRTGRLIGIDQDAEAIEAATKRLEPWQEHVSTCLPGLFRRCPACLRRGWI